MLSRSLTTGVFAGFLALSAACGGAGAPSSPDVWAVVNGTEINRSHVERLYRTMLDPAAPVPTDEEALEAKLNILDDLIRNELLVARAPALNISPTADDVASALADQRGEMTEEEFTKQLGDRRVTLDEFRDEIRRQLTAQKVVEKEVQEKVVVTDDEVAAFFEKNRQQFNVLERRYHLVQIVVNSQPNPQVNNRRGDDATTPDQAQRKLTMLMERLRTGDSFTELAADFSEDPQSAPQGGDIGFVPQSAIDNAPVQLRNAVRSMKPGDVNTITAGTQTTILALVEIQEPGQRELTDPEVKDAIRDGLKERRLQLLQNAYITLLHSEATVVNYLASQIVNGAGKAPDAAVNR